MEFELVGPLFEWEVFELRGNFGELGVELCGEKYPLCLVILGIDKFLYLFDNSNVTELNLGFLYTSLVELDPVHHRRVHILHGSSLTFSTVSYSSSCSM